MKSRYGLIILIAIALCSYSASGQTASEKKKLITKMYNVLPTVGERISASHSEMEDGWVGKEIPRRNDWKVFFAGLGVKWPDGSDIKHIPSIGKLVVVNTEENLKKFEEVLKQMNVTPYQISIELKYIEYLLDDVEKLAKSEPVCTETLLTLWKKNKGKVLFMPSTTATAGTECSIRAVEEYIYPTDFTMGSIMDTNTTGVLSIVGGVVEPSSFETREVGTILTVVPEVSPEGQMINLTMMPEVVYKPVWKNYGSPFVDLQGEEHMSIAEQPFFYTHSLSTSISIYNGSTLLLGGGMPSREKGKVVYAFVTARLITPSGKILENNDPVEF